MVFSFLARLRRSSWDARKASTLPTFIPPSALALLCLIAVGAAAGGDISLADTASAPERVRGFFCNAKNDSLDFLLSQASGENEEMAANAVNKSIGKFSCAYYLPANAIFTGEHTVIRDGLVFKLQSYIFLPEQVERWSGSVFGSLQASPGAKQDV
jgi:hypothetical protein